MRKSKVRYGIDDVRDQDALVGNGAQHLFAVTRAVPVDHAVDKLDASGLAGTGPVLFVELHGPDAQLFE